MINTIRNNLRKMFGCYLIVRDDESRLELCMKWLFIKTRKFVAYESLRAIYACDEDSGFTLYIFLTGDKKVILTRPLFENQEFTVANWEDLIHILTVKCPGFNKHNLALAEKLIEVPILCWHSGRPVDDIEFVEETGVFWKKSGEKFPAEEINELSRNSKNVGF